jgi:hypothetical protein
LALRLALTSFILKIARLAFEARNGSGCRYAEFPELICDPFRKPEFRNKGISLR